MKNQTLLFLLCLLALTSLLFALRAGSVIVNTHALYTIFFTHHSDATLQQIIFTLRLPRTCAAFVTGGLLALAGAMMQLLLKNPLADPYVLGISGGGAVAALLSMLCGLSGYWLTGAAWLGSLTAMLAVFLFAHKKSHLQTHLLLLAGVAASSGFAAFISFILLIAPNTALHGMLFWLLGDLSDAHLPAGEFFILLLGFVCSMKLARQLNILMHGTEHAKALGIETQRLQWQLYLLTALLTAAAVTLAGCIGFVGLIVPHFLRLLGVHDYRYLLPGSILLGGSLLTTADTLARTVLAPQQLPVGIMMALIGIPVFLVLLRR